MITLKLTKAEAQALAFAVGNSIDAPDVAQSLFQTWQELFTAYRAREKLNAALYGGKPDLSNARQCASDALHYDPSESFKS